MKKKTNGKFSKYMQIGKNVSICLLIEFLIVECCNIMTGILNSIRSNVYIYMKL